MPNHPYKQPLHIQTNSKQDGDLINTYDKENTESREDTKIYVETPCGKNHGQRRDKSTIRWSNTRSGSQQKSGGSKSPTDLSLSLSFSGGFGGPKLSLNLPNPSSLSLNLPNPNPLGWFVLFDEEPSTLWDIANKPKLQ